MSTDNIGAPNGVKPPSLVPLHTKKQTRATLIADSQAIKAKWKTLVVEASKIWPRVPPEDLAKVDGNFHRLAGLIQLRYLLTREETDTQVKAFFATHYPAT